MLPLLKNMDLEFKFKEFSKKIIIFAGEHLMVFTYFCTQMELKDEDSVL